MGCGIEIPKWTKIKPFRRDEYVKTLHLINRHDLNTVCIEANCPNRYECFSKSTATFMILGSVCTRNCRYCNIKSGKPEEVDAQEPGRIAEAVKKLKLDYAVITCVTRDDLEDEGAGQFVKTVREIKKKNQGCRVELLISDLNGNWAALKEIVDSGPDVVNHNIEVVKELFPELRPKGSYERSIELLKKVKEFNPRMKTKSGLIVGLGETRQQIIRTLKDLRKSGCDILTVGQYLQPSQNHAEVKKFYEPKEFDGLKTKAESLGFEHVEAGPWVRSSYGAGGIFSKTKAVTKNK